MLAALNALPANQALAVCGFAPVAILALCFFVYEATGFLRLAWRGR